MRLLHQIGDRKNGSNFNTLEEIMACQEDWSFDGIYESVWNHRHELAAVRGKRRIILFVMGQYVGGDNSFDAPQPFSRYLTWEQLFELSYCLKAEIGWHSHSHPNLTTLTDERVRAELRHPFPMKAFAYPGGAVDARIAALVKEAGFEEAWSVTQGDGTNFQKNRPYLNW